MATIAVVVCNQCEELGKPTRPYGVKQGRRSSTLDLCEEHGAYLETFLNGAPPQAKVAAKKTTGRRKAGKVSMAEIERLKK